MIKLLYCLRRRSDLTLPEFQEHWLERHRHFGLTSPYVRRYVQYHTLLDDPIRQALAQASAAEEGIEPYDGLAAAWFDGPEALAEAMQSDTVAAALEDEKHFIDHSRSAAVLTDEHVIVEPEGPGDVVLVECIKRRDDIDRRTFSERWLGHSHIGKKANSLGLLQGYIQNHALAEDDARVEKLEELGAVSESWDGIVTAYFHSIAVAKELFTSPLASEESYEDEKTFIDHSQGVYMLARRHAIKDLVR